MTRRLLNVDLNKQIKYQVQVQIAGLWVVDARYSFTLGWVM